MTSPLEVGDLIAGKYRVERLLGKGGMGVVVAAVHVNLGQRVAVKFLLPSVGGSPAILTRFEREARAAVALHSEHVARVLDVGHLPDGAPYMVMELLEGTDLAQELRNRKWLPTHEAVAHILQACDAIAEAHGHGLIHRDIKPSNLFLAQRPKRAPIVKVLDFGISKTTTLTEGVADLTSTHELIGSPLYMSPEQLRAPKTVDARSDVWSLGVTLYELVSGEAPFDGATMAELSAHIMMTPVVDVRSRNPRVDIHEGLAAVIGRCLAKDPADRYESVEALALALTPFATMMPATARPSLQNPLATTTSPPAPPAPAPAPTPAPAPAPTNATVAEREKRATSEAAVSYPPPSTAKGSVRRLALPMVAALAIAVAGGTAIVAMRDGAQPSSRGPASAEAPPTATSLTTPSAVVSAIAVAPASASASASALPGTTPATHATVRVPFRPAASSSSTPPPPVASAAPPKPSASTSPLKLKLE